MQEFDELKPEDVESLRHYVSPESPFGPENASSVKDETSRVILFNRNNLLCQEYRQNPRIIIGRRGSGKTTITSNTSVINNHSFILQVQPEEAMATVRAIAYPANSNTQQYPEAVARVWRTVLNSMLMAHVCANRPSANLPNIRRYLAFCNIPVNSPFSGVMTAFKKRAETLAGTGFLGALAATFLESLNSDEGAYEKALDDLDSFFKSSKLSSVVIIDSIEDYLLNDPCNVGMMAGLLKCAGEYGNERRHIRLCIPGEVYFDIKDCSSNPLKDFTRNLLLHWLPSEIYSVIAWRYTLYNRIYNRQRYEEIREYGLAGRAEALRVIDCFLPQKIENALGSEEPTLPYIMRHTQILPRQVIVILNSIFGRAGDSRGGFENVTRARIVEGINRMEGVLCDEIFSAFKYKYPRARSYCQNCVPELPRVFNNGLLHKVFNRHGKSAGNSADSVEYYAFKRMLVEMGVIGRVRDTTGIYAEAEFEYAQPGRLNVSVDDELCLHPIFSGEFSSKKNAANGLVVYPQKEWFDKERGRYLSVDGGHH